MSQTAELPAAIVQVCGELTANGTRCMKPDGHEGDHLLRIDLGCGPSCRDGYVGADRIKFNDKVVYVFDAGRDRWPWADGSVDEVQSSHFLEHLTARERCHAMNELYRVLKPGKWENGRPTGGFACFVVPHWASCRAYGDPTHAWPPMGEFWTWYLDKGWRAQNAPHTDAEHLPWGYACDFIFVNGQTWNPALNVRNDEYKAFAMANYKEAVQDLHINLVKR
jgi:SAM-dependent methyltransferase